MGKEKAKIYTVSQVNGLIKGVLESNLPGRLTVAGEISDWKEHSPSGHCYFSLKDEKSNLPCAMWKPNVLRVRFRPENGLAVLASGFIDVYVPRGRYQLIVDEFVPAGVGALQLAFEQMVKKLRAEGLFEDKHKKRLPAYPARIGILTSESGAAVRDIEDSIFNRWPCVKLFLYPVPVQGEGAAEKIAAAIRDVNRRNKKLKLDILIVGRGGGSREDLWAFNEEVLARAIFESQIPVISAVGHEVDVTIADYVADARASTPTKAGVVAVPDYVEVLEQLGSMERRIAGELRAGLDLASQRLETLLAGAIFRNPLSLVHNREQQVDEVRTVLVGSVRELLASARKLVSAGYEHIVKIEPHRLLGKMAVDVGRLGSRADAAIKSVLTRARMGITAGANRLAGLNPKAVLKRGYSITTVKGTGKVVRKREEIEIGDLMVTELAEENLIESKVTKK